MTTKQKRTVAGIKGFALCLILFYMAFSKIFVGGHLGYQLLFALSGYLTFDLYIKKRIYPGPFFCGESACPLARTHRHGHHYHRRLCHLFFKRSSIGTGPGSFRRVFCQQSLSRLSRPSIKHPPTIALWAFMVYLPFNAMLFHLCTGDHGEEDQTKNHLCSLYINGSFRRFGSFARFIRRIGFVGIPNFLHARQ